MKKIIYLIIMMMCFAPSTIFAQEVRGVETKIVVYNDGPKFSTNNGYSTEWFGYSFHNMNSIPVSVDVELYRRDTGDKSETTLISTKSFVLQANESYIWKHETNYHFRKEYKSQREPTYSNYSWSCSYYVKYKAYKLL